MEILEDVCISEQTIKTVDDCSKNRITEAQNLLTEELRNAKTTDEVIDYMNYKIKEYL